MVNTKQIILAIMYLNVVLRSPRDQIREGVWETDILY
jgi:hypothetical protein